MGLWYNELKDNKNDYGGNFSFRWTDRDTGEKDAEYTKTVPKELNRCIRSRKLSIWCSVNMMLPLLAIDGCWWTVQEERKKKM